MIRRVVAFVLGDMVAAEGLSGYPKFEMPAIAVVARTDEKLGEHLVGLAKDSRDRTDAIVNGLADKAASFLTLVIGLFPLFVGVLALSVPPEDANIARWIAFALLAISLVALGLGAVRAVLATGMMLASTTNLAYIKPEDLPTAAERLASEAADLNFAAILNMEAGLRRARDLFQARRLTLIAVVLAAAGVTALVASVGGHPASLLTPRPVSSSAPTVGP